MKKYNGLLAEIAREFHIEQGEAESMERWKARIVYSLPGLRTSSHLPEYVSPKVNCVSPRVPAST